MGILGRLFGSEPAELDPVGARRLARLLVAEIRLSEPYKLQRGVTTSDVCGSLDTEIREARKGFHESYPQDEADAIFNHQLLDVLANGDRTKMGATFSLGSRFS